jgi:2-methylcitrate dehydratase PrpD
VSQSGQKHDGQGLGGQTLAQRQAAWIAALDYDTIPEAVRVRARLLLLDFLGVARRGASLPHVEPARALLEALGTIPESSVIGGGQAAAPYAAYANATFGHSCEYDDAHWLCGHPGVCVIPAALALAERDGGSGKNLIMAIVAGYQAMVWSVGPINRRTLDIGWHGMKVGGVFGAAAAASKMLGLASEQIANALAIAGSDASGTMEYDQSGGEVKRFHAGMASRAGTQAALLAQAGLTGPLTIFEGLRGIHRLFAEGTPGPVEPLWDGSFHIMTTMVKLYPMVGTTHAALDALGMILDRRTTSPEEIESIEVGLVDWAIPHGAAIIHPHDMLSAQFSLAFAVALRIVRGLVSISDLENPIMRADPVVNALANKVRPEAMVVPDGAEQLCGRVTVRFTDGTSETAFQPSPRGFPTNPPTEADIQNKFNEVMGDLIDPVRVQQAFEAIMGIEARPSLRGLVPLLG